MKLCIDCKHYLATRHPEVESFAGEMAKCVRGLTTTTSPVSGAQMPVHPFGYTYCSVIRQSGLDTECGPDGRYFERGPIHP